MSTGNILFFVILLLMSVAPQLINADENWHFRVTPYIWFAGLEGDVATIPGAVSVPIDISPSDAIKDTEAGLMILFEAKRDKHGVFADFLYTDVQSNEELIPAIGLTLGSVSKTTIFSLAYQYEIYRQDNGVIDLMVGTRFWDINTELDFGSGIGPLANREIEHKESWIDPFVGVKGHLPICNSKFYIEGGAGLGGFGVNSDLFYEVNGVIGYKWNSAISTAVGYRLFDVDYEEGGFTYDVRQAGWQIGLTWAF